MTKSTSYQVTTAGIKVGRASTDLSFVLGQAADLAHRGYAVFIRQHSEFERNTVRIREIDGHLVAEAADGYSAGTFCGRVQQIIDNLNGKATA